MRISLFKKAVIVSLLFFLIGLTAWVYQLGAVIERDIVHGPFNTSYSIEGDNYQLVNGKLEKDIISGSASKIRVDLLNDFTIQGDINGDGLNDSVVILDYSAGGSGTFYYVAVAIRGDKRYYGSDAIFIGDRVSLQDIKIQGNIINIKYSDRYPWQSFRDKPSVEKEKHLIYKDGILRNQGYKSISQNLARQLVINKWGSCRSNNCSRLGIVLLDGRDNTWYVQVMYNGIKDDSVATKKIISGIKYSGNQLVFSNPKIVEYQCQLGRGHQYFSKEQCK